MNNLFILILNFFLYLITFVIYQKKRKYLGIGSTLLMMYLAIALIGIDLYFNKYSNFLDLKILPSLYLYFVLMMTALPLLLIDERKIVTFIKPNLKLFKILSASAIFFTLISAFPVITKFNEGLRSMLLNTTYAQELYSDAAVATSKIGSGGINIFGVLSGLFSGLVPLLFFSSIIFRLNKFFIFGLGISIIVIIITPLSMGQRGGVILSLFNILFGFIFLRKFLSKKTHKVLTIIFTVFLLLISIPFTLISIGRFSNTENGNEFAAYQAEFYIAHSFISFNNYGIYKGPYLYGDRTIPLFKRSLGIDTPKNLYALQAKINSKYPILRQKGSSFHTYVGDFVFDFGNVATIIILALISLLFWLKIKLTDSLTFHKLILIYFLFSICNGIFLHNFCDTGGNLKIIFYLLIYFLFRINWSKLITENKSENSTEKIKTVNLN